MATDAESHPFFRADLYIAERVSQVVSRIDPAIIGRILAVMGKAPKIFVYGAGRSGIVGRAFAMRLVQCGLSAYVIGESVTPIVQRGDVVFIFSGRGESYSSISTANIVRREGADLIVITAKASSKLAHTASILLSLDFPEDGDQRKYAPLGTLFESASLRVGDALVAAWMHARGETEESMRRRHAIMV